MQELTSILAHRSDGSAADESQVELQAKVEHRGVLLRRCSQPVQARPPSLCLSGRHQGMYGRLQSCFKNDVVFP